MLLIVCNQEVSAFTSFLCTNGGGGRFYCVHHMNFIVILSDLLVCILFVHPLLIIQLFDLERHSSSLENQVEDLKEQVNTKNY